jgi:H+/Cl- antiporter ClcA
MTPMGIPVAAPQAYALVGVAAMLAANCQVPLTSVLLLFELTQDYYIILPTLAAVGISYCSRRGADKGVNCKAACKGAKFHHSKVG